MNRADRRGLTAGSPGKVRVNRAICRGLTAGSPGKVRVNRADCRNLTVPLAGAVGWCHWLMLLAGAAGTEVVPPAGNVRRPASCRACGGELTRLHTGGDRGCELARSGSLPGSMAAHMPVIDIDDRFTHPQCTARPGPHGLRNTVHSQARSRGSRNRPVLAR